ncbi:hypothetical protein ACN47E_003784 [Coniothyrium glycines]
MGDSLASIKRGGSPKKQVCDEAVPLNVYKGVQQQGPHLPHIIFPITPRIPTRAFPYCSSPPNKKRRLNSRSLDD